MLKMMFMTKLKSWRLNKRMKKKNRIARKMARLKKHEFKMEEMTQIDLLVVH